MLEAILAAIVGVIFNSSMNTVRKVCQNNQYVHADINGEKLPLTSPSAAKIVG